MALMRCPVYRRLPNRGGTFRAPYIVMAVPLTACQFLPVRPLPLSRHVAGTTDLSTTYRRGKSDLWGIHSSQEPTFAEADIGPN